MRFVSCRRLVVPTLLAAVVLAACGGGGGKDEQAEPPRSTTTSTAEVTTSTTAAPTIPLLGVAGEGPARPALVVKIDNAPLARPQAGINAADVVVEEAVEGGITRLFAIFHSTDADPVGPVRSARSTDVLLAGPLARPLFAYSGANAGFLELLRTAPLLDVGVDAAADSYRLDGARPAPYNLFTSTASLWGRTPAGAGAPPPLLRYRREGEALVNEGAAPAVGVRIEFRGRVLTKAEWGWDPALSAWVRNQNETPHTDAAGARVATANVIVQLVPYRDTGFVDQSGEPVPEAVLVGQGEAWVFTEGQLVRGRWRRSSVDAVTEYVDAAGEPVLLTPGRTWIELAPPGSATAY